MVDKKDDKLKTIRIAIDNAPVIEPTHFRDNEHRGGDPRDEPPPHDGAPPPGGPRAPLEYNEFGLPKGCPIVPLGIDGKLFYYLDAARQLQPMKASEHQRLGVQGLFGRSIDKLYEYWPRVKDETITGWRPELAAEALMKSAARRGVWNPFDRVRGVGAWRGDQGELILHCGDKVWLGPACNAEDGGGANDGTWHDPGLIGRFVYPADKPSMRFAPNPVAGGENSPADKLLALLETWNFRRGKLDARLLLGWFAAAMIGGALTWRPMAWLTGDSGTGKSTLKQLIDLLFDGSLIGVSNTSAAGVWTKLGHRTVPVNLEEQESQEDNRKNNNLMELARQASSGGMILRGSSDHQVVEFTVRSCFLFGGIVPPPMMAADRSRIALLELDMISGTPPVLEAEAYRTLGLQLRRRLVDGWPRLQATLDRYRSALQKVGHTSRGADQFGALLACADLLLHDALPDDADSASELEELIGQLKAEEMNETSDNSSDAERCAAYVLTQIIDPYRNGQRHTVAEWILKAADIVAPEGDGLAPDPREANRVLGTYGLRIERDGDKLWLVVANYHAGLAGLYHASHWAGRAGTLGGWITSWRRFKGAMAPRNTVYFAGVRKRGTWVPLEAVLEGLETMPRHPATPALQGL